MSSSDEASAAAAEENHLSSSEDDRAIDSPEEDGVSIASPLQDQDQEEEKPADAVGSGDESVQSIDHSVGSGKESPVPEDAVQSVASDNESEGGGERSPSPIGSPAQADLFGDADDIRTSSSEEGGEEHTHAVAEARSGSEDDEERGGRRQASAPVEETLLNAEIPRINVDLGNQIHFVKFPNFLSVDPRPFDPETYEDEVDEDDVLDEEGRSRLKLKVENTIRWKLALDEEGNLKRESNAKFVRWSDGSLSLYLGSEVFDVHIHPLQGDHHHLFIRQGTGLQGRNVFRTKLTFRPHSTDSFTHRKMTLSMADKTSKAQKVKVLPAVGKNPEAVKQELIKKEEERMRASARRESQQRRMKERTHGRALSAAFLEPDRGHESDEGDVSLSAIKNRYKTGIKDMRGGRRPFSFDDEEEEEEEEEEEGSDLDRSGGSGRQKATTAKHGGTSSKRIIDSDEEESDQGSVTKGSADRESTERADTKRRAAHIIEESEDDD